MVIIGIDPGTETTGYGVLKTAPKNTSKTGFSCVDYGVLKTLRGYSAGERLLELEKAFTSLLKTYTPDAIGIERLFFAKNQKTVMAASQAKGVILKPSARFN